MSALIVAAALVIFALLSSDREKFVEKRGFAGYDKPTDVRKQDAAFDYSGYTEDVARLTSDEMNDIIRVTQEGISTCAYPIETNSIKKYTKTEDGSVVYKCAFTFMAIRGFPFGFGVNSDVMLTPAPKLMGIRTQPMTKDTVATVVPYQEEVAQDFTEFEMITKKNVPTLAQLKAGENAL